MRTTRPRSATDLYPGPLSHAALIRNLTIHPWEFHRNVCFVIAGAMPAVNRWGKLDFFMVKRVRSAR
ncbi:MAG: hypothetical protein QF579_02520 [Dehalococcoidia bacterium]|nr:hypothetical protein [Dehalococcoidia bacterium]